MNNKSTVKFVSNRNRQYRAGLDIGSTTAKIAIVDQNDNIVFTKYERHNTKVFETIEASINEAIGLQGNLRLSVQITGSAGLGVSERTGIPFLQEVIATDHYVKKFHPDTRTLIDIGGEDSKMIFFNDNKAPDIRMNGNCAGGTGAFIDQIASLLNISLKELDDLARQHSTIYSIASRCGVFAKTDVQNLISRKIPKADIAASIFHAVSIQSLNTLARGFEMKPKIILCGGPFTFFTSLGLIFQKIVKLGPDELIYPEHPELLPAVGAAIGSEPANFTLTLQDLLQNLITAKKKPLITNARLDPLFQDQAAFNQWQRKHKKIPIAKCPLDAYESENIFLGVDSGSTTTKIAAIGENDGIIFSWYSNNLGNPVDTLIKGLETFHVNLKQQKKQILITKTAVTGYGEDLIKSAFGMDHGMVETIAHFTAARHIKPDVSFVLDIGGQDMKAIFIENGMINRIEVNEACSSGCGSFIETFSNSLDHEVADFAQIACSAEAPCDLGTRCTVFMNSKVKQSLRENASVEEISAGLAYSVIKNCLFKVLKLNNMSELGDHIVIQGGTFKNPSIVRALELLTEKEVKRSDTPELMGAFGAALIAKKNYEHNKDQPTTFVGLEELQQVNDYKTRQVACRGCENRCAITRFTFSNQNSFFSGNKCEKFFTNKGEEIENGQNLFDFKQKLLFDREASPHADPVATIGIPRCLNLYENYPFWHALFTGCGINLKLSAPSTMKMYEKGLGTVMSDSICFPAKLTNGHIVDLIEKKVDRIFYPTVIYETNEFDDSLNSFNCPIVSGYPDVVRSAIDPAGRHQVPFDTPVITFADKDLLKKSCIQYLKKFGIKKRTINQAFAEAFMAQKAFKTDLRVQASQLIDQALKNHQPLFVLAGRPYHLDSLINHRTPEMMTSFGAHVIPEDAVPMTETFGLKDVHVLTQWHYPNRIYHAAKWVAGQPRNIQLIQFNSFGCGPDAIVTDEVKEILKAEGKNYTVIKVDEITSIGSVRLRLRSMIESLKLRADVDLQKRIPRTNTPVFSENDKHRTILAPWFAEQYSPLIPGLFELAGYKVVNLPKPDRESVEYGLRFSNHDICYPATIVIGDIIKALKTGSYNPDEIAVGITQTGGQCRASSYLSLIKKALLAAGYKDIPVISVTTAEGLNDQPGFEIEWLKLLKPLSIGVMVADSLAKMFYATVVREKQKGESQNLFDRYMESVKDPFRVKDYQSVFNLLEQAVADFNEIAIYPGNYPKMGIVGEIYVKYNAFGHQNVVNWLVEQGIEVVVPPILDFFLKDFLNYRIKNKSNLRKAKLADILGHLLETYTLRFQKRVHKSMTKFRFYTPFHNIKQVAKKAGRVINLVHQFGEGWLIAAEIAAFADEKINHVLSLQPFGCIANQIVSKGIETRIKKIYPDMNLLFLDFEAGTSEVNILNRLYFMVKNVKDNLKLA